MGRFIYESNTYKMKLSFVIPAYNEEKYLADCITAILNETSGSGFETEIIVVNNASTDNTKQVAKSFPQVIVVDEPQKGLVKARSAGFNAATGSLIANIDSDTRITKGWLKKVMSEFENNPKLVALSGPYQYYDLSFVYIILVRLYYYLAYILYLLNRYVFRLGSLLQGGNFVIKKSSWESVGGFDTKIDFYGEDADVARRLHKVGDVKFTLSLRVLSSGRRLVSEGAIAMGSKYAINFIWIMLFGRPFSNKSNDFRN